MNVLVLVLVEGEAAWCGERSREQNGAPPAGEGEGPRSATGTPEFSVYLWVPFLNGAIFLGVMTRSPVLE